jgi:hypothetical protein
MLQRELQLVREVEHSVIARALFWHHNRRAALPAETLAVDVVLAESCQSTDTDIPDY